jgi:AAA family ATP:ADP antiporter
MKFPGAFWNSLTGIRGTESARLFLMSAYLLLIITCYTTTKAVRDSLFITEVGPSRLPYLYMLIAASMAGISLIYPRVLRRIGLYSLVQRTSMIAVASLVVFWWLVAYQSHASYYTLYVWVSLFGAITASQAWSIANHVFDAREARRSFSWIALGGVVGGIVGGTLARVVAPWWGTEALLPVCAALMVLTMVILHYLPRSDHWAGLQEVKATSGRTAESGTEVLAEVRKSRYLSLMVVLLIAGVIVEAFIDYEFKMVSHGAFRSKDQLTSFFGAIASYGGVIALLFQTLVTHRLLKHFGVGMAILLLPAALLGGFTLVALWPALWAVSVLKLIDGGLSYSVHRSGMELLYVPVPANLRAPVKALIDLLVDRVGRAAGGLLLLALTAGLSLSIPALSIVAAVCLAVWLAVAVVVRRNYVHAFRVSLEKKVIEPESLDARALDSSTIATLRQALSSDDDRRVLYALDLLGKLHPSQWPVHFPSLIEHKSASVRSAVIAILTEWQVFSANGLVSARLRDPELDVRVEAIRYLCSGRLQGNAKLKELLAHDDYTVVLAALHCMAKYQLPGQDLIDAELIQKALAVQGEHELSAKTAAARALAIAAVPGRDEFLERLLHDPDVAVVRQAMQTAGDIHYEASIPFVISALARHQLRRVAREALLKLGTPALSALLAQMHDERTPLEVKVRIPKVLSFFGGQSVADFLLASVHASTLRMDMPVLSALNRLRESFPEITFDHVRVSGLIRRECEKHGRLGAIQRALLTNENPAGADGVAELLVKATAEKQKETLERVFRLLALVYAPVDIRTVFFNLTTRPALRASAVEFLDNLMEPELRNLVVPVVEDVAEDGEDNQGLLFEEAVQTLRAGEDEWLKTISEELSARLVGALDRRTA